MLFEELLILTVTPCICVHCSNFTKFSQLILRKIIKIVATRCQILRLKCTKFGFGCSSAPDPVGGDYSAPQTLSLDLTGPTSKGNGGRGRKGRAGEGRGGERKGRNGKGTHSGLDLVPLLFCGSTPMMMMNYISCYSHKNIITPIYFMLFVVVGIYHA